VEKGAQALMGRDAQLKSCLVLVLTQLVVIASPSPPARGKAINTLPLIQAHLSQISMLSALQNQVFIPPKQTNAPTEAPVITLSHFEQNRKNVREQDQNIENIMHQEERLEEQFDRSEKSRPTPTVVPTPGPPSKCPSAAPPINWSDSIVTIMQRKDTDPVALGGDLYTPTKIPTTTTTAPTETPTLNTRVKAILMHKVFGMQNTPTAAPTMTKVEAKAIVIEKLVKTEQGYRSKFSPNWTIEPSNSPTISPTAPPISRAPTSSPSLQYAGEIDSFLEVEGASLGVLDKQKQQTIKKFLQAAQHLSPSERQAFGQEVARIIKAKEQEGDGGG
jgi:hypothetical protein